MRRVRTDRITVDFCLLFPMPSQTTRGRERKERITQIPAMTSRDFPSSRRSFIFLKREGNAMRPRQTESLHLKPCCYSFFLQSSPVFVASGSAVVVRCHATGPPTTLGGPLLLLGPTGHFGTIKSRRWRNHGCLATAKKICGVKKSVCRHLPWSFPGSGRSDWCQRGFWPTITLRARTLSFGSFSLSLFDVWSIAA